VKCVNASWGEIVKCPCIMRLKTEKCNSQFWSTCRSIEEGPVGASFLVWLGEHEEMRPETTEMLPET
jgi:hypothetical protein